MSISDFTPEQRAALIQVLLAPPQPTAVSPQSAPRTSRPARLFGVVFGLLALMALVVFIFAALSTSGVISITRVDAAPTTVPLATAAAPTPPRAPQQPVSAPLVSAQPTSAPVYIVVTAAPLAEPTALPLPTADVASVSDVDTLANAVDQASGGNPAAATPVPIGAELPTVVIRPVDPSGGDTALMARALANSDYWRKHEADERAAACALDLAYGGAGCTPVAGIDVQAHVGSDGARVSVGVGK